MMNFKKHVKIRQERFGAVLFETLKEKVFITNHTGSRILALIEEGKDIDEIARILTLTYSADGQAIKKEVAEFIDTLKEKEVLA